MSRAIGPDISFYQDDNSTPKGVDFEVMKAAPSDFVIIRAGQNTWVDPDFDVNWAAAKAAGLPRGSYWYYDSRSSPQGQAQRWAELMEGDTGELPLFADYEENYGGPYGSPANFYAFLKELEHLLPEKEIMIYTGFYFWEDRVKPEYRYLFEGYGLWIARYNESEPWVPEPWEYEGWDFWQYTQIGDGAAYGVESLGIDLNYYNGTVEEFKARFGLDEVDPPPVDPPAEETTVTITYQADGPVKFVFIDANEEEPEEPPDPPPLELVEYNLIPKEGKKFVVIHRTPDTQEGFGGKAQYAFYLSPPKGTLKVSHDIPQYRRHMQADGKLHNVQTWETLAEKLTMQNDWACVPVDQVVHLINGNYKDLSYLWRDKDGNWSVDYVFILKNLYLGEVVGEPEPPPPPVIEFPREIVIPDDGYTYYQLRHDWDSPNWGGSEGGDGKVRQAWKTAPGKYEALPETAILNDELWIHVPTKWREFLRDCAKLDSPTKSAEFHKAAYQSLVDDHRAFTDLGHFRNFDDYDWKVSLSTGGNIVRGYQNGTNLIVDCFDISKDPPKAEDVRNEFWRLHFATQIWPHYYRNPDKSFTDCRFEDGTYKVTHFPQGRSASNDKTGTTFPLWGQGDTKIIESRHIARELKPGEVVKIVNLARDH